MKIQILFINIISLFFVVIQCVGQEPEKNPNSLLCPKVEMTYLVKLKNSNNPEWSKGLKSKELIETTVDKVFSGKVKVYYSIQDAELPLSFVNSIIDRLKQPHEIKDVATGRMIQSKPILEKNFKDDITNLLFQEEWFLDEKQFLLNKDVKFWSPVIGKENPENLTFMKHIPFSLKCQDEPDESKISLISKDIFYEFSSKEAQLYWYKCLDWQRFILLILKKIDLKEIKVYNPDFVNTLILIPLSKDSLDLNLGCGDPKETMVEDVETGQKIKILKKIPPNPLELTSIIFHENWYLNSETLNLKKEVLGFFLVKEFSENGTNRMNKKIVCYIPFNINK